MREVALGVEALTLHTPWSEFPASCMLPEDELSSGLQQPVQVPCRSSRVGQRAHDLNGEDAIDTLVGDASLSEGG